MKVDSFDGRFGDFKGVSIADDVREVSVGGVGGV